VRFYFGDISMQKTNKTNENGGLTKNQIITLLTKSPHKNLSEYLEIGKPAADSDPEFFAHLIAWDRIKGQIRDSKAALPIISLNTKTYPAELLENSYSCLSRLNPRELLKADRFMLDLKFGSSKEKKFMSFVGVYLSKLEKKPNWDSVALQHRSVLKELYALNHIKASERAHSILFDRSYPPESLFGVVNRLNKVSTLEAVGLIIKNKIPFLIALGALGKKLKEPDCLMALIERMTPTELETNAKMLERCGIKNMPAVRAAFEEALERAAKSKKTTLKTSKAIEVLEDESMKAKLTELQEQKLNALQGIEGNWLVISDCSGSMEQAIEVSLHITAFLAKMTKGKVLVAFCNTTARLLDASGRTYEELKNATRLLKAQGGTSLGCGLVAAMDAGFEADGIAVISDANENSVPLFPLTYPIFSAKLGKEVPVYLYRCKGTTAVWGDQDLEKAMRDKSLDLQVFDLRQGIDYYSLPNLAVTMRTNRYSLAQEILDTPLLTLDQEYKEACRLPLT
jgi:hypothetical protein